MPGKRESLLVDTVPRTSIFGRIGSFLTVVLSHNRKGLFPMKRLFWFVLVVIVTVAPVATAQVSPEKVDTATISRIKDEGLHHSQAMDLMSYLTDVCGSRLTWSPEFKAAADWTSGKLKEWKLQNVHLETWTPYGRGWTLKHFSAHMLEPKTIPLIGYPKAWSPGTDGTIRGKAVFLDVKADSDLAQYKGKLKGAIVLVSDIQDLPLDFKPFAERLQDDALLKLANAEPGSSRRRGAFRRDTTMYRRFRENARLMTERLEFCRKEKALAIIDAGHQDGGTLMVMGASEPQPPDSGRARPPRVNPYEEHPPAILPQVTLAAEHYNRIMRILQKGIPVKLELEVKVAFTDEMQPGMNVIGEIPGSDLKDEVVMIGAHLDSWHAGTGACDNGTGVITAMEAMRILTALDLKPRRTIRIGLWGGEEEGLFGSRAYVSQHLGERTGGQSFGPPGYSASSGELTKKEGYNKFSVYFNDDNGTGTYRGIYLQGNEACRTVFRAWLAPFQDLGASTISAANTGGTDHLSFDAVDLPGFQFIQDPIEYGRTYHSNMDVYERVSPEDLKQDAVMMASFAYTAAMRDEELPRKPLPIPPGTR
jgi:carboxypeptidase Q